MRLFTPHGPKPFAQIRHNNPLSVALVLEYVALSQPHPAATGLSHFTKGTDKKENRATSGMFKISHLVTEIAIGQHGRSMTT